MALSFKHLFSSAKPDGTDATKVRASNWNAEHLVTMATAKLLGRTSPGIGEVEEIATPLAIELGGTGNTTGTGEPGPPGPMGGATGIGYIYLSQNGVVGDGSTDDTAALNTLFNSLIGETGTIVWDVGFCKTTGRVTIGDESGGAGAATTFLNILCPYGNQGSGIKYNGPTNDVALRFAKWKYSYVRGLTVTNQVAKGTTIGIQIGGAGAGSFGNQVISCTFDNCAVYNFATGITDGNSGAASEITYRDQTLASNDTGWYASDFNTLDHTFINVSMSDNGVGLDLVLPRASMFTADRIPTVR